MNGTPVEIYKARMKFFNDSAEQWIDRWYRDPETGEQKKHEKDFDRLFGLMPIRPGHCVLDAGCGTGVMVPRLLHAIGPSGLLYELDFAEKMIEINRRLHPAQNIRFLLADVAEAPLAGASCETVVCFSCFPHFEDKDQSVATLGRILKPGGRLVISHFESSEGINSRHKACPAVMHDHLPDETAMRDLIARNRLEIERFLDEPGFYYLQAKK